MTAASAEQELAHAERAEDAVDVGAVDGSLGRQYQAQPPLAGPDEPPGGDEHAHPAGIAEQDLREVQDEAVPPLGHLVVHALAQHR
ncbi:hypothetical protein SCYAM73S_07482 [Streptomyces cyaneofuscatus]